MKAEGGNFFWKSYKVYSGEAGSEYELTMFRIVAKRRRNRPFATPKGPILLIHGAFTDSITWMDRTDETEKNVGSLLAEEGYDVWYANMRGTRYSRENKKWDADADKEEFWDYDFSDLAKEDVPAMIKKIIEVNGSCTKVSLVGHSLGSQNIINLLSQSSVASNYIAQSVAMAPCLIAEAIGFVPFEINTTSYVLINSVL